MPDGTLLTDEISALGIRSENDFFGGVVPYPFAKTKAITHPLVDGRAVVDEIPKEEMLQFAIVLETELRDVVTYSVGHIRVDDMTIAYHGRQRTVTNSRGRSVYGGSDLVCVRGGWQALERLYMADEIRLAVAQARSYDCATREYPGLMASRRNYDVGKGIDGSGHRWSGVFEASWRCGGASTAELAALTALSRDSRLSAVKASAVKEFGATATAPSDAAIDFCGEDTVDGPVLRYTRIHASPMAT